MVLFLQKSNSSTENQISNIFLELKDNKVVEFDIIMADKSSNIDFNDFLKKTEELLDVEYAKKNDFANRFLLRIEHVLLELDDMLQNGIMYNGIMHYVIGDSYEKSLLDGSAKQPYCIKDLTSYEKNRDIVTTVMKTYYNGNVAEAYALLSSWWSEIKKDAPVLGLLTGYTWYKMRKSDNKFLTMYSRNEMFHIPFDKLGLVAPYRFSISGHPCLYLGRSLYICWEEMDKPQMENVVSVGVKAKQGVNILDLRMYRSFASNCVFDEVEFLKYLSFLPIIFACSFRAISRDDKFIPEYVFPQMLLSVIESDRSGECPIYGITYSSTRFDKKAGLYCNKINVADCIAIPTRTYDSSAKYCAELSNLFTISEPINLALLKIKAPGWESQISYDQPTETIILGSKKNMFELLEDEIKQSTFTPIN